MPHPHTDPRPRSVKVTALNAAEDARYTVAFQNGHRPNPAVLAGGTAEVFDVGPAFSYTYQQYFSSAPAEIFFDLGHYRS
jgi:hypothetical protein